MKSTSKLKDFVVITLILIVMTVLPPMDNSYAAPFTGTNGDVRWVIDTTTRTLTFSGSGEMPNYTLSNPWESNKTYINHIIIEPGITTIGDYCFKNLSLLEDVSIPNTIKRIGKRAFYDCDSLNEVDIPYSVDYIGEYAFSDCTALNKIVLPSSLKTIDKYAFSRCDGIIYINIPDSVEQIGEAAFRQCRNLKEIKLPKNLKSIEFTLFTMCGNLDDVIIPNGVDKIGYGAFSDCKSLQYIDVPTSVELIDDYAFAGCTALKTIYINNPDCIIEHNEFNNIPRETTIYGYGNSTAEAYSLYMGNDFVSYCEGYAKILKKKKDPTCSVDGYTGDYVCSYCGRVLTQGSVIPALGHILHSEIKESTCAEVGYKKDWCVRDGCNYSHVTELAKKSHRFKIIDAKAATCSEEGNIFCYYCTLCNKYYRVNNYTLPLDEGERIVYPIGHQINETLVRESTCEEDGIIRKYCTRSGCNYSYDEKIEAVGHKMAYYKKIDPSCMQEGQKEYWYCSNCENCFSDPEGKVIVPAKELLIPKGEHNYLNQKLKEATCEESGECVNRCSVCNDTYEEEIPALGHDLQGEIDNPATMLTNGYVALLKCKRCNYVKQEVVIPKVTTVGFKTADKLYGVDIEIPSIVVRDCTGKLLLENCDYQLVYDNNSTNIGRHKIVVIGIGAYRFSKALNYTVYPSKPTISKIGVKISSIKVSVNSNVDSVTGIKHQLAYKVRGTSKWKYVNFSTNSKTIKNLLKKKRYIIKARNYKIVDNKRYYSKWSAEKISGTVK